MRKIYHLGLHKTGTTSLQLFLWRNRKTLARNRILYPPATPKARDLFEIDDDEGPPPLNAYMSHNALAYRMIADAVPEFGFPPVHTPMDDAATTLEGIAAQARETGARTLLFCSEDLARAGLMAPSVPRHFADRFGQADTLLIAAIRRPDEAIAAWQTQMLRFHAPFPALRDTGAHGFLGLVQFEYRAALEPWCTTFQEADKHFLPYADLCHRGGALRGLSELGGIALPEDGRTALHANPGLPHVLMELGRRGLAALPRASATALRHYLENVPSRLRLPPDTEVDLFTPEQREIMARSFAETHHWLSQITGRIPFFDDLDEIRRSRPVSVQTALAQLLPDLRRDSRDHLEDRAARGFLETLSPL